MTKPAETMTLDITERQYDLLAQADQAVRRAAENKQLVLQSIVAGHDVPDGASVASVEKTPPRIIVTLPEEPAS